MDNSSSVGPIGKIDETIADYADIINDIVFNYENFSAHKENDANDTSLNFKATDTVYEKLRDNLMTVISKHQEFNGNKSLLKEINGLYSCVVDFSFETIENGLNQKIAELQAEIAKLKAEIEKHQKDIKNNNETIKKIDEKGAKKLEKENKDSAYQINACEQSIRNYEHYIAEQNELKALINEPFISKLFQMIKLLNKPAKIANEHNLLYTSQDDCKNVYSVFKVLLNDVVDFNANKGDIEFNPNTIQELQTCVDYINSAMRLYEFGFGTFENIINGKIADTIHNIVHDTFSIDDIFANELIDVKFTFNAIPHNPRFNRFFIKHNDIKLSFEEFIFLVNPNYADSLVKKIIKKYRGIENNELSLENEDLKEYFDKNPAIKAILANKHDSFYEMLRIVEYDGSYNEVKEFNMNLIIKELPEALYVGCDNDESLIDELMKEQRYAEVDAIMRHFISLCKRDFDLHSKLAKDEHLPIVNGANVCLYIYLSSVITMRYKETSELKYLYHYDENLNKFIHDLKDKCGSLSISPLSEYNYVAKSRSKLNDFFVSFGEQVLGDTDEFFYKTINNDVDSLIDKIYEQMSFDTQNLMDNYKEKYGFDISNYYSMLIFNEYKSALSNAEANFKFINDFIDKLSIQDKFKFYGIVDLGNPQVTASQYYLNEAFRRLELFRYTITHDCFEYNRKKNEEKYKNQGK